MGLCRVYGHPESNARSPGLELWAAMFTIQGLIDAVGFIRVPHQLVPGKCGVVEFDLSG